MANLGTKGITEGVLLHINDFTLSGKKLPGRQQLYLYAFIIKGVGLLMSDNYAFL